MKYIEKLRRVAEVLRKNHDLQERFDLRSEFLKYSITNSNELGVRKDKICGIELVVSLTTYDKRLYSVALTIESIMQGSLKPNRIILWLQDDLKDVILPNSIKKQMERGLEVYYTKNILSYKKIIPTLLLCQESLIVTIDDDVLYEYDTLDRLFMAYCKNPSFIYGCRVKKIGINNKGIIEPYQSWTIMEDVGIPSNLNMCIGVGGVLYPAHCFSDEVFNEEAFMRLCPHGDDLWFWLMAKEKGFKAVKVYTHHSNGIDYISNVGVQDISLRRDNVHKNGNDLQFMSLAKEYDLLKYLTNP